MARLSIPEAVHTLGLSQDTIRKRLRSGDLQGQKVKGAGGFRWEVFVADDPTVKGVTQDGNHTNDVQDGNHGDHGNDGALVDQMQARIDSLETQLTTRAGEIDQLHRLLAQTALNAAPGGHGGNSGGDNHGGNHSNNNGDDEGIISSRNSMI